MKFLTLLLLSAIPTWSQVKTATLHPLLADLVAQIGGDHIKNQCLIGKTGDPHHFEPTADQLQKIAGTQLYFLSGKGLESYLPSLKNIVKSPARIIEVGATLPSIEGSCSTCDHDHDHDHEHEHQVDPHWWHSIDNFRRAAHAVEKELTTTDPAHAADFKKNTAAYTAKLDDLDRWARKQIATIPKDRRHLATAHDAFAYFCKDYSFTAYPVQGVNREQVPDAKKLSDLIADLKKNHVIAIFPEKESNPKILTTITKDTGIKLGDPLSADGTNVDTYEEMMRQNITAIVKALRP